MIVEWRAKAREDRSNIFDYIAEDNPTAALELDDRIEQQTDALPERPELYRVGRRRGTRPEGPVSPVRTRTAGQPRTA